MGNKKKKSQNISEEDVDGGGGDGGGGVSPDEAAKCKHVAQKVNANKLKNVLPHAVPLCQGCHPDADSYKKKSGKGKASAAGGAAELPQGAAALRDLWICLKCGYLGCNKDGIRHAMAHRTDEKHTIVMNIGQQHVWCFECDDTLAPDTYPAVDKCVEIVQQFLHRNRPDPTLAPAAARLSYSGARGAGSGSGDGDGEQDDAHLAPARDAAGAATRMGKHYISSHNSSRLDLRQPDRARGLVNLGNTCFFNAAIQSVARAAPLRDYLARDQDAGPVCEVILVPEARNTGRNPRALVLPPITLTVSNRDGPLKALFRQLIAELHTSEARSVNPSALFGAICRLSPRFSGFQQQDSQELLRTLLDHLDHEERLKVKVSLLEHLGVSGFARSTAGINAALKTLDADTYKKFSIYIRSYKSFVETIFSGRFCSIVVCDNCLVPSRAKEDFLDLSVPILVTPATKKKPASKKEEAAAEPKMSEKERKKLEKQMKKEAEKLRKKSKKSKSKVDVQPLLTSTAKAVTPMSAQSSPHPPSTPLSMLSSPADTSPDPTPHPEPIQEEEEEEGGKDKEVEAAAAATATSSRTAAADITITETSSAALDESTATVNGHADTDSGNGDGGSEGGDSAFGWNASGLASSSMTNLHQERENPEGFGPEVHTLEGAVAALTVDEPPLMGGSMDDVRESRGQSPSTSKAASGPDETAPAALQAPGALQQLLSVPNSSNSRGGSSNGSSRRTGSSKSTSEEENEEENEEDVVVDFGVRPGTLVPSYDPKPGECSIESCLAAFCKEEILDGDNMFACENCNRKSARHSRSSSIGSLSSSVSSGGEGLFSDAKVASKSADGKTATLKFPASKQILIESLPRVLTLHAKRFSQTGFRLQKVSTHVDFPLILDIAPFCTSNAPLSVYGEGEHGIRYGLFAVVEHQGRLNSGHYVAYAKDIVDPSIDTVEEEDEEGKDSEGDESKPRASTPRREPRKPRWWLMSDTSVHEVSEAEVLKSEAYVLFYERYH